MKPINELLKLEDVWLDEIYDRLWYEYFTPLAALNKDAKKFIREQLNFIADEHNKSFPGIEAAQLKVLKANDTWENDGNGPLLLKSLYVDCLPAVVIPDVKKKKPVVEDEDLLGSTGVPKLKRAKVQATEGKSKYEMIAELCALGKSKDQIQEATGFERKTVTDMMWRYNKLNPKK